MTRRHVFFGVSAVVVVAMIVTAHDVLLPFVLALVIAYVLTPLVAWVERRRLPRALAIVIVYAIVLGSIALFVRMAAPRIGQEIRNLRAEIPALSKEAKDQWAPAISAKLHDLGLLAPAPPQPVEPPPPADVVARPLPDGTIAIDVGTGFAIRETTKGYVVEPLPERKEPFDPNRYIADAVGKTFAYAQDNSLELAKMLRDVIAQISKTIFYFFLTLMLAAYLMLTREKIVAFMESLVRPASRASFTRLLERIDRGLAGVVRGQLIICLINGVLSAIGFAIVGLKYWPVLALVAAVLSLIPIFGSIISSVPAVAIGLTQGIGTAVFVLVWIVGIHQIEANLLNPKIMGDAAKIHPVLVIFSLLVGEHFFHAVGALLAVPCMSIALSLFLHFREVVDREPSKAAP